MLIPSLMKSAPKGDNVPPITKGVQFGANRYQVKKKSLTREKKGKIEFRNLMICLKLLIPTKHISL